MVDADTGVLVTDAGLGEANGQRSGSILSGQQDMDAEVEDSESSKAEGTSTCGCVFSLAVMLQVHLSRFNYKKNNEVMFQ